MPFTRRHALLALAGTALHPALRADTYPSRPITVLVAFPAGGLADTLMRALAQIAEKSLKQPLVVENRPGALGLLGANAIARAQPDGYTLLQTTQNVFRAPHLGRVQYDPKEFTYIIGLADNDHALFVGAQSPYKDLKGLTTAAQQKPDSITVGTTGIASTGHLLLQDFSGKAKARFNHVPYKGAPELGPALIGGHIDAAFLPFYEGYKLGDKVRLVAVFGDNRPPEAASVPTAKEQGIDAGVRATFGLVAPKGTPEPVVRTLHEAFRAATLTPEYQALLKKLGMVPWYKDPAAFTAWSAEAVEREKQLVLQAGLTPAN